MLVYHKKGKLGSAFFVKKFQQVKMHTNFLSYVHQVCGKTTRLSPDISCAAGQAPGKQANKHPRIYIYISTDVYIYIYMYIHTLDRDQTIKETLENTEGLNEKCTARRT